MKSRGGKSQRREEKKKEDHKKRKSQKKEDPGVRKGRKVAKHCVFPMICGKVGLLKRRVQSPLARWEMKNCTPLWREAHLQVKKLKAPHVRNTFGSWDAEKVHAVVARSTLRSQNVQNTPMLGPLLEVETSKKCTRLWREAQFEVKM